MGNITMVDGHVPDGSYQNVTANGSCSCDAGMRFDGLRARGSFDAMGLDGGNVHCEGRLVCRGDMHVSRISGHGELHVGGDLRCSALDFTGKIIADCCATVHASSRDTWICRARWTRTSCAPNGCG